MVNRSPAAAGRLLLVVSFWALAMPGSAQTTSSTPVSVVEADDSYAAEPAHVAYIDGIVEVTRDRRAEPASINIPLVSGDQVRTRDGRVEIVFGDGSVLDADQFTTIDLLSDELIRLTDGRIRLTIGGRGRVSYRVDTPSAAVRIDAPGEYRISLVAENGRHDVELVSARGYATLVNDRGETGVRAGERAFATAGMAPSYAQAYNSAAWDAFDRWSADRRDERTGTSTTSAQYLPEEVQGYAGDFDRYGAWQYDVTYGYVWYPRVYAGWRPYYYGRWSYYNPWGWTWISYHPWGWPTHHYGRWGFRAGVWFWIPSHYWAPAYVYWAGASNYVGWCPLGWNNQPIFALHIGYSHYYGHHGHDPYRGWTVVPRHAFHNHVDVRHYAVARAEIDRAVPRWYVSGATAPVRPAAITRQASPIYSAGRSVMPRGRPDRTNAAPSGVNRPATAGISGQPEPAPRGLPGRAVPRGSEIGATREYRGGTPGVNVPRATPPAAAGALGWPTTDPRGSSRAVQRGRPAGAVLGEGGSTPALNESRSRAIPRAPYRDAGPGGREPRYQVPEVEYRSPGGWERRPMGEPPRRSSVPDDRPAVGAPPGVPQGGIYGQRGVPRTGAPYAPPQDGNQRPAGYPGYYPAPSAPSRAQPGSGPGGVYPPRSSPPPSYGAPAPAPAGPPRGAPPAARPSGGERGGGGGERAVPRGGGSAGASRPSGGGHSRTPQ